MTATKGGTRLGSKVDWATEAIRSSVKLSSIVKLFVYIKDIFLISAIGNAFEGQPH